MSTDREIFTRAVNFMLDHEGGYSNNPADNGGETKYGISKHSYPKLDIANLTKTQAIEIYYRDFWASKRYKDIIDASVAIKIFDLAVNMGPAKAHILVQKALNSLGQHILEDGVLGCVSIGAINKAEPNVLLDTIKTEAANYYRSIASSAIHGSQFLNGWLKRAYA